MKVRDDIKAFLKTLPNNLTLVAATKYVDAEEMAVLLDNGVTNFGENRVTSFLEKYEKLKGKNITWHFIGHLQRNKAKLVANKIDFLHSLDSIELATVLDNLLSKPLKVFIEVSINHEENKSGVLVEKIDELLLHCLLLKNIKVIGLMMMSIKSSNEDSLNSQFLSLEKLRDSLENKYKISLPFLSMGMSDDYLVAIKHKSTHIRLGRILFINK